MKSPLPALHRRSVFSPPLVALAAAVLLAVAARAAEESVNRIAFSDPARPGTLKIQIGRGDLRIEGTDTSEIVIRSESKPKAPAPRKDGLRVLTASATYSLTEKDNIVTLDALSEGWSGAEADFRVTVPRTTSLIIQNSWGGDVTCTSVAGDLEINSMNGRIRLDGIAGGVVVSTMNGEIHATVQQLQEKKPLSFTSMNGEVLVRVPAEARANVRLRTQNGSVLTDFDENALVTRVETVARGRKAVARTPRPPHSGEEGEVSEAVRAAMQEAADAVREGAVVAREALRAAVEELRTHTEGDIPAPPRPPLPVRPTPTGGKLVTGALNGGGPEISIATMNGDVTLRRAEVAR